MVQITLLQTFILPMAQPHAYPHVSLLLWFQETKSSLSLLIFLSIVFGLNLHKESALKYLLVLTISKLTSMR